MRCPSCRKRVVFGSIRQEAWERIHSGEWLLGGRPPKPGALGDCPDCGVRLEWEPGEEPARAASRIAPPRVHLSALRESPQAWRGEVALRALVIEWDAVAFASDSWRNRPRGEPESDRAMLDRLVREQVPRVQIAWAAPEPEFFFRENARTLLDGAARAAWAELEGSFEPGEGGGVVTARAITSIWPPRD